MYRVVERRVGDLVEGVVACDVHGGLVHVGGVAPRIHHEEAGGGILEDGVDGLCADELYPVPRDAPHELGPGQVEGLGELYALLGREPAAYCF